MVAQTNPARANTYSRFAAACQRAIDRNIRVLAYRDGRAIVSASNGRDAYVTDGETCACKAGQSGDPICVHRSALTMYLYDRTPDPEPPAPAACPVCAGRSELRKESATFAGVTYRVECPACRAARLAA